MFRVFTKQRLEQALALCGQLNVLRVHDVLHKHCFIDFVRVLAVEGREPSEQFVEECSHAIVIDRIRMADSMVNGCVTA